MKKVFCFIAVLFLFSGWTIFEDFEDGTTGQVATVGSLTGGSDTQISETYAYSGSKSARFYFKTGQSSDENWNAQIGVNVPTTVVTSGTTEIWMSCWAYYGEAGDNPSGEDFSWSRENTAKAPVQKHMRMRWRDSSDPDVNYGWASVYETESKVPRGDLEFTSNINIFQDSPQSAMTTGEWRKIELYIKAGTASTGQIKMWIDDTLKIDRTTQTIHPNVDRMTYGILRSVWNGGSPKNQYMWIDDFRMSTDGPSNPSGTDTTAPVLSVVDPEDGSEGVSTSKVMKFTITDSQTGVDTDTVRVTFDGNDVTSNLGFSGNLSSSVANLTLSDISVSAGTTYAWSIGSFADLGGNTTDTTISGNLTTAAATASNVFASGDMGDSDNYDKKTSSRWQSFDRSGDIKFGLNTSSYEGLEYALYNGQSYERFDITGKFTCTDDLVANTYSDLVIYFNFTDVDNCYFFQLNATASVNGFWKRENANPTQLTTPNEALITDNAEHTFQMKNNNGTIEFYVDGTLKDSYTPPSVNSSQIGFGSQNDIGEFDDIVITELTPDSSSGSISSDYASANPASGSIDIEMSPTSGNQQVRIGT